eukprot:3648690-Lingulodinium_polyedra.AAC.1
MAQERGAWYAHTLAPRHTSSEEATALMRENQPRQPPAARNMRAAAWVQRDLAKRLRREA